MGTHMDSQRKTEGRVMKCKVLWFICAGHRVAENSVTEWLTEYVDPE